MEVELLEIQHFLAEHHPFDLLNDEQLTELPEQLEVTYLRRGSELNDFENKFFVIRSGALEVCADEEKICEQLDEGGIYACGCSLFSLGNGKKAKAIEDTLVYVGTCQLLYKLSEQTREFGQFFTASINERLKQGVAALTLESPTEALNHQRVSDLIRMKPVCIDGKQSIQTAAQIMSEKRVGSMIITLDKQLAGLVTDRDIRERCVANGIAITDPISSIMSAKPHTIKPNTTISDALLVMTQLGIHHLPVMDYGQVVGMFTSTDIVKNQGGSAAYLTSEISRASNVDDLINTSQRIPLLHHQLVSSGASVEQIGKTLSHMTDAITARLIKLAEDELGPAPAPFVWLAGGSQGRLEQSSHSDQDNALLIDNSMRPEHDAYFATLAKRVTDGLNLCGYIYCPGNAMASNPDWRQPVSGWTNHFTKWIRTPEPMALMLSSIWFDLRPVYGDFSLFEQLQRNVVSLAKNNKIFLTYMMANAATHRPPLGFFRQFVLVHDGQHNDTLDLKHTGIVPVTDIARMLALSGGITAVNTLERLREAAKAKLISEEMAENLEDALTLIAGLRVRHQSSQIAAGEKADNFLDPDDLSGLERSHLKQAFQVIKMQQDIMIKRFGADNLR